jgi:hypothetical protein
MADKPDPICIVCGGSILTGMPRYRAGWPASMRNVRRTRSNLGP